MALTHFRGLKGLKKYLSTLLCFCSLSGFAINAKPGLLSVIQPDGSVIEVSIIGSEHCHRVCSSDGFILLNDESGYYVFADADENGQIIATDIRAVNPENRSIETQLRIKEINTSMVWQTFQDNVKMRHARLRKSQGLISTSFPTTGKQKALVILVEFTDKEFTIEDPKDYFYRMLNEEGFADSGATGSARDYFIENSSGQFIPQFDVFGPVKLPNDTKYYGSNDRWGYDANPQQMAIHACNALDDEIDFSQYDADSDGNIDNIFFYYAGYGEADGGGANTIWPHSTRLSLVYNTKFIYDGVQLDRYACSNEMQSPKRGDCPDGIGTFCHEFSHVMGLPDLYATATINLTTPGSWDLMDNGSYNNNGMTPANLSSYERYALGWLTPVNIWQQDYTLTPLDETNMALISHKEGNENEYYIFENRQQQGFDAFLPGHGMLVWHVDYRESLWNSNTVNDNIFHQYVDLVEADGMPGDNTREGDPFPGTKGVSEFTRLTNPAFKFWGTNENPIGLKNIRETDDGLIFLSAMPASMAERPDVESIVDMINSNSGLEIMGNILFNHTDGVLEVYEISGIKKGEFGENSSVELSPGFYIAKTNNQVVKFIIPGN